MRSRFTWALDVRLALPLGPIVGLKPIHVWGHGFKQVLYQLDFFMCFVHKIISLKSLNNQGGCVQVHSCPLSAKRDPVLKDGSMMM